MVSPAPYSDIQYKLCDVYLSSISRRLFSLRQQKLIGRCAFHSFVYRITIRYRFANRHQNRHSFALTKHLLLGRIDMEPISESTYSHHCTCTELLLQA